MKKLILIFSLSLFSAVLLGQTIINETFPLANEGKVSLKFEYPQLVKVSTWDKKEIGFKATVMIDDGAQDDKFSISYESEGGTFYLKSKLDKVNQNGNYVVNYNDDGEEQITYRKNGNKIIVSGNGTSFHNGVEIDIVVEVMVPKNVDLNVFAKFGLVEVSSFPNSLAVEAEFGGVDLTLNTNELKELDASTAWGQIYTDLSEEFEVKGTDALGKDMIARLKASGKKQVFLETNFGDVFLRRN